MITRPYAAAEEQPIIELPETGRLVTPDRSLVGLRARGDGQYEEDDHYGEWEFHRYTR